MTEQRARVRTNWSILREMLGRSSTANARWLILSVGLPIAGIANLVQGTDALQRLAGLGLAVGGAASFWLWLRAKRNLWREIASLPQPQTTARQRAGRGETGGDELRIEFRAQLGGYEPSQVDEAIDRMAAQVDRSARLRAAELESLHFDTAFRGYHRGDVDAFIERLRKRSTATS